MNARRLEWDACLNARETGGYRTREGGRTRYRALVRSDNLSRLTPDGRAALEAHGIRTVIDLRTPGEVVYEAHHYSSADYDGHLHYLNLPIVSDADLHPDALYAGTRHNGEGYLRMIDRRGQNIAVIVRAFAGATEGGVLVHCHAGKDRTGLIVALLLAIAGVDDETIAADYAESTKNLRGYYEEQMRAHAEGTPERARLQMDARSDREWMLDLLAYLRDRYGSPEGYLRHLGLADGEIDRIRARLLE